MLIFYYKFDMGWRLKLPMLILPLKNWGGLYKIIVAHNNRDM